MPASFRLAMLGHAGALLLDVHVAPGGLREAARNHTAGAQGVVACGGGLLAAVAGGGRSKRRYGGIGGGRRSGSARHTLRNIPRIGGRGAVRSDIAAAEIGVIRLGESRERYKTGKQQGGDEGLHDLSHFANSGGFSCSAR